MTEITENVRNRLQIRRELTDPAQRRARREAAGLSQQELASAIGVSRQAISQWESGLRNPRGVLRDRYAEALRALRDAA